MKGLVLFSGGLDSTTALAVAREDCTEVLALSIMYGSVHSSKEMTAAQRIVQYYKDKHEPGRVLEQEFVSLPAIIFQGSGSALLGESEIPNEEYHPIETETPSATVVPYRNGLFIAMAVALAAARSIDQVYIANHATDAQGFAYPDCTPEFVGASMAAAYIGTHRKVRLVTPFQWMSKSGIVEIGFSMHAPYHLTWSCYRGGEKACGRCPTCKERLAAFRINGLKDPIEYES